MTTPEIVGSPPWVTIAQAAELLGVSAKTIRRRLRDGSLAGEMRHDPDIGGDRWYVDGSKLPTVGPSSALVPLEVLESIEKLHREITEAVARAERAETVAEFQTARRAEIEAERDALRAQLERRRWWRR